MQLTRLSFVLATCSSTLYATDTAIELPTVNVQATAPARTVSEIGAAQIEREQPADLKALLKNQPGVAVSALQRTAFQANDKVVYGFATKLLTGELMDIKANYSKDMAK